MGSSAQYKCIKQTAKALKIELASYRELQAFAQFGSDLDEVTKKTLIHGDVLMEVLKQNQYAPMDFVRQTVEIFTVQHRYLDSLSKEKVRTFLDRLWIHLKKDHADILEEIRTEKALSDTLVSRLKDVIASIKESLAD